MSSYFWWSRTLGEFTWATVEVSLTTKWVGGGCKVLHEVYLIECAWAP